MKFLFWSSICLLLYVYIGYPVLLFFISLFVKKRKEAKEYTPKAIIIFAAHNEEEIIEKKLQNCLSLDYPKNKLQIAVVSDASTDRTNEIVRNFTRKYRNIFLFQTPKRMGTTGALKWGVERTDGNIFIRTDATSILQPSALKKLLRHFSNKKIGCVGGTVVYTNVNQSGISKGQGIYWQYETMLKKLASKIGCLNSVSGGIYAVRRSFFGICNPYFADDDISPLNTLEKGYKVILEYRAIANDFAPVTPVRNLQRQIRTTTRGIRSVLSKYRFFNPFHHPLIAFDLFSHRILRWCSPISLFVFLISSISLSNLVFYRIFLLFQILFCLSALIGLWLGRLRKNILPFNLFFYVIIMNLASFIAILNFLRGEKIAFWEPVGAR